MGIEKGEIITLENNKEYICFASAIADNQKRYLYLMTTSEPIEICFGEETVDENGTRIRVLGKKEEKQIALAAFKNSMA